VRLLWLAENYPPDVGGMAWSCDRIVAGLRDARLFVDVVHFDRRRSEWTVESGEQGALLHGPITAEPGHTINLLWHLVDGRHKQFVYTHVVAFGGFLPLLAAPPFAKWLGTKLVTLLRGNDFDTGIFSPRRTGILTEALRSSDAIAAVTSEQVRRVRGLLPNHRIAWTPNGIDLESWKALPSDLLRGAEWKQGNVEPGRRVLGLFGQLKEKKGALFFLESLARSPDVGRFHVLIVGTPEPSVLEFLRMDPPPMAHTFVPFCDRYALLPYYAATDIAVVPSFYDGMPNVLLEAVGLGVPILASHVGGMVDVLNPESAILFSSGNRHACSRAIDLAAHVTHARLVDMARLALKKVSETFNRQLEIQRFVDLFRSTQSTEGAG
jgi:glycosyltransferase involved in cell wall biosynthesis